MWAIILAWIRSGYILLNKQVSPSVPEKTQFGERKAIGHLKFPNDCVLSFISGHQKQVGPDLFKDFYTIWKETEAEAQEVCICISALFIRSSFHTANWFYPHTQRTNVWNMDVKWTFHACQLIIIEMMSLIKLCLQECKSCISWVNVLMLCGAYVRTL